MQNYGVLARGEGYGIGMPISSRYNPLIVTVVRFLLYLFFVCIEENSFGRSEVFVLVHEEGWGQAVSSESMSVHARALRSICELFAKECAWY